ncbi:hypothetical protein SUGI_0787710 [Cryptomeria japonica]|uniref:dnaJ protein ERDJ3A isoform X2 n=1 Tax=Cryptomeria japonica TaxID=3369 RepID=UPI002414881A|nr:dnaJ protein ERDJ3A isoform X2 [Cryptomeria japonica]GLJ38634.1 hypothetical protein SUGI_0787710 [Cryptomeria japonica]
MRRFCAILGFLIFLVITSSLAEAKDLYKILGVDKNASQREIQKAFHKLSLKYHPDKNTDKNAQAKFSEINNAYETLSDEEKRKNYDMFGDEKGNPRPEGPGFGNSGYGSSNFNFGGQNGQHFTFQQGRSQSGSGKKGFKHFPFPFGGSSREGGHSFTYDIGGSNFMGDIFSNIFGSPKTDQRNWNPFGGFAGPQGQAKSSYSQNSQQILVLDSKNFKERVLDQRMTWLLMFYTPSSKGYQELEAILDQVSNPLQGIVKVGAINCHSQQKLCKEQSAFPQKTAKLFVYSIRSNGKGSLLEYNGDWNAKDVKNYCIDLLPRFSKRIGNDDLDDLVRTSLKLPKVLLLTTRKNTPAIWRALSGLYHDRVLFYDAEVSDQSHHIAKIFGVQTIPAMIGILSNGEVAIMSSGSGFEQSGPHKVVELGKLIENLEKRNLKVRPAKESSQSNEGAKEPISLLTKETSNVLCGTDMPLCVIGVFKSSKGREKAKELLTAISQKTLTRGQRFEVKDAVSYSLLDAAKQKTFLRAFDKSGFKDMDAVLIAYKPRKERFALYKGSLTMEDTERFIGEVLNGDVRFTKVLQKPRF